MKTRGKSLLILAGSEPMRREISECVQGSDIEVEHAASGAEGLAALRDSSAPQVDGIILDWVVSGAREADFGAGFIQEVQARFSPFVPPVIVLGPPQLESYQAAQLHSLARISPIRYAPSLERLLDETMLTLHRPDEALSDLQRMALSKARQVDASLAGRKILVVDDYLRNIFALTSVLEQHEITVLHA